MRIPVQPHLEAGPHTYYADSAGPAPSHPRLLGELRCDVCVIGGGFTGISAALNLAEAGYSVVLLEGAEIGWGASGRNGGQMITGYAPDMTKMIRMLGSDHARQLWELSLDATHIVHDRINTHQIDAEYKPGYVLAAARPGHMPALSAEQECLNGLGYAQSRMVDRGELGAIVASSRFHGGLVDMGSGHLHPLKYVRGLARAAAAAGVRIFEHSRVERILPANESGPGAPAAAFTDRGVVRCENLVLCCNAYIGNLQHHVRSRIMPVGTYIIATEPMSEARSMALLPTGCCISDTNFVLDYFRLSADHRMLFGGRVSYTTLPPPHLVERMRQRMLATFPELHDLAISHSWGGYVDISMNRLPDIGRLPGRIYYAQGFSGQGVALTGLAGKLIASAIRGDNEKFDVFARIPHRAFPGGPLLRMPLLLLATLYSRLQDMI